MKVDTILPFQARHKLNYFLICQKNWILIVSYDKKFKNSCNQPSLILEPLKVAYYNNLLNT
jgi:hypothetical protein